MPNRILTRIWWEYDNNYPFCNFCFEQPKHEISYGFCMFVSTFWSWIWELSLPHPLLEGGYRGIMGILAATNDPMLNVFNDVHYGIFLITDILSKPWIREEYWVSRLLRQWKFWTMCQLSAVSFRRCVARQDEMLSTVPPAYAEPTVAHPHNKSWNKLYGGWVHKPNFGTSKPIVFLLISLHGSCELRSLASHHLNNLAYLLPWRTTCCIQPKFISEDSSNHPRPSSFFSRQLRPQLLIGSSCLTISTPLQEFKQRLRSAVRRGWVAGVSGTHIANALGPGGQGRASSDFLANVQHLGLHHGKWDEN